MDEKGFVEGVRRYMSQLREEKRYSSAKSYQDALNSFIKYSGTENISYSDINKANLHRYEAYLLEKGCMCNTVSTYMRRIRCVYNKAIEDGDAEYIPGLFQGVFTGVESKRKKSLSLENQHKLMTVKVESEVLKGDTTGRLFVVSVCRNVVRGLRPPKRKEYQKRDIGL